MLPEGNTVRATRAVSTVPSVRGWGCSDIAILLVPLSEQTFLDSTRGSIAVILLHEFACGIKSAGEPGFWCAQPHPTALSITPVQMLMLCGILDGSRNSYRVRVLFRWVISSSMLRSSC